MNFEQIRLLTWRDRIIFCAEGILLSIILAYAFYSSPIALIIAVPFVPAFVLFRMREKTAHDKRLLRNDFREVLTSLQISLRAGYAIEHAFRECERYIKSTLGDAHPLSLGILRLNRAVETNIPVEEALLAFGRSCDLEEIEDLSIVLSLQKRLGGDIASTLTEAAVLIDGKIDVEREIEEAIAARRYEQRLMSVMPLAIILYMKWTAPEFISPLYGNVIGILVMSGCLMVYAFAFALGVHIVNIEV